MAKASHWNVSDGEGRKLGERLGLDTPVVPAVNNARLVLRYLRGNAVPERRRELAENTKRQRASGASVKRAAWGVRSQD